jgi:hypothetical protein
MSRRGATINVLAEYSDEAIKARRIASGDNIVTERWVKVRVLDLSGRSREVILDLDAGLHGGYPPAISPACPRSWGSLPRFIYDGPDRGQPLVQAVEAYLEATHQYKIGQS